jgi:glutamate carboxypeptidase
MRTLTLALLQAALTAPALVAPAAAQNLHPTERAIARYVDEHLGEAIGFLEQVVNVNSGTMNHNGVRQVGRLFRTELDALGFATRWVRLPDSLNRAGHLFAERAGDRDRRLLLIGHLDTVFEADSPFQRFSRADSAATGPGVEDMKGGNVVILYALKALHAAGGLDGARVIVALTGDEEDPGDPLSISRGDLIQAARRSDVALGFEGAVGGMHTATVARRGFTGWTLHVTGRRGHSSVIFGDAYGAGAIYEAARILDAFYAEIPREEHLTFGPGIILGGSEVSYDTALSRGTASGKTNVIPEVVTVAGDLRTLTVEQRERAKEQMRAIVARSLPGTAAEIEFRDSYPPMAPTAGNHLLLEALDRVNRDLGYGPIQPVDPDLRGAADVSFVAPYGDALDGLGVLGSGGHTHHETVDLRTLPVATKRAAILIYRLTRGEGTSQGR